MCQSDINKCELELFGFNEQYIVLDRSSLWNFRMCQCNGKHQFRALLSQSTVEDSQRDTVSEKGFDHQNTTPPRGSQKPHNAMARKVLVISMTCHI